MTSPKDFGFEDKNINAAAYSDAMVGEMIEKIKESNAWDNTLIIIVADHTSYFIGSIDGRSPRRHRIPMIWCGGAIRDHMRGYVEEVFTSQIDIPATLLAQMGVNNSNFVFSRNIYSPNISGGIGYYTFNDGYGVVNSDGATIHDVPADRLYTATPDSNSVDVIDTPTNKQNTERERLGKALLQMTHQRIEECKTFLKLEYR